MASVDEIVTALQTAIDKLGESISATSGAESDAGDMAAQMAELGVQDKATEFAAAKDAIERHASTSPGVPACWTRRSTWCEPPVVEEQAVPHRREDRRVAHHQRVVGADRIATGLANSNSGTRPLVVKRSMWSWLVLSLASVGWSSPRHRPCSQR